MTKSALTLFIAAILLVFAGKPANAFDLSFGATTDLRVSTSGSGGAGTDFGLSNVSADGKPSHANIRPTLFLSIHQKLRETEKITFGLVGELHSIAATIDYPHGFDVGSIHFTEPSRARLNGWDVSVGPYAKWALLPWGDLEANLFVTHQRLILKTDVGSWNMSDTLARTFPQARLAANIRLPVMMANDRVRLRLDYNISRFDQMVNLTFLAKVF